MSLNCNFIHQELSHCTTHLSFSLHNTTPGRRQPDTREQPGRKKDHEITFIKVSSPDAANIVSSNAFIFSHSNSNDLFFKAFLLISVREKVFH